MTTDIAPFRKRDFEVTVRVDQLDPSRAEEFAEAIYRAKPSRLDNILEIEVTHKADKHIQMICDKGMRALTLKTVHPELSPIRLGPLAYMMFEYEDGGVVDQWTAMGHRNGDEPMVDVLKISFEKKTIHDAVWQADEPKSGQRDRRTLDRHGRD
jgi:hypothetical protein